MFDLKGYRERYYQENKEQIKGRSKKRYLEHKEECLKTNKNWMDKHPEKVKGYKKNWRKNNSEKTIELRKEWVRKNLERMKELRKKYYHSVPWKFHARARAYKGKFRRTHCLLCLLESKQTKSDAFHHTDYQNDLGFSVCRPHHQIVDGWVKV